jgi:hypothetical protein
LKTICFSGFDVVRTCIYLKLEGINGVGSGGSSLPMPQHRKTWSDSENCVRCEPRSSNVPASCSVSDVGTYTQSSRQTFQSNEGEGNGILIRVITAPDLESVGDCVLNNISSKFPPGLSENSRISSHALDISPWFVIGNSIGE